FGRLEQGRRASAELLEQGSLVRLGCGEITHLDVAEPADFLRDRRKADRKVVVLRREPGQNLLEHGLVVGDQRPLGPALRAVTEDVEGSAAQAFELGEEPEESKDPRPERDLARTAG